MTGSGKMFILHYLRFLNCGKRFFHFSGDRGRMNRALFVCQLQSFIGVISVGSDHTSSKYYCFLPAGFPHSRVSVATLISLLFCFSQEGFRRRMKEKKKRMKVCKNHILKGLDESDSLDFLWCVRWSRGARLTWPQASLPPMPWGEDINPGRSRMLGTRPMRWGSSPWSSTTRYRCCSVPRTHLSQSDLIRGDLSPHSNLGNNCVVIQSPESLVSVQWDEWRADEPLAPHMPAEGVCARVQGACQTFV